MAKQGNSPYGCRPSRMDPAAESMTLFTFSSSVILASNAAMRDGISKAKLHASVPHRGAHEHAGVNDLFTDLGLLI